MKKLNDQYERYKLRAAEELSDANPKKAPLLVLMEKIENPQSVEIDI